MKELAIHIITWILNNKSDELAALSIFLGMVALVQSWKYSKDSEKIMKDTSFMLVQQIALLNELKKIAVKYNNNSDEIDMSKDDIRLHKLCRFQKRDIPIIMQYVNQLAIKRKFKQGIEDFLYSKYVDYECNFFYKAQSRGAVDVEKLYEILLRYNVIMIIDYY